MIGVVFILLLASNLKADCDSIRDQTACQTSTNQNNTNGCWWDSKANKTGHSCKAFSGDCTSINTTFSSECTGAGRGGKCLFENGTCIDGNVCSKLGEYECSYQDYCFWDVAVCKRCEDGTGTNCPTTNGGSYNNGNPTYCRAFANKCVKDCETEFISDPAGCAEANTGCCWNGNTNDCLFMGTTAQATICPPVSSCSKHNGKQTDCNGESTLNCSYDSITGTCNLFQGCGYIHTNVKADCDSASNIEGRCKWTDLGCVNSCPYTSTGNIQTNCESGTNCWYDSNANIIAGLNSRCKDFVGTNPCASIPAAMTTVATTYPRDCWGAGNGKCYWNSTATGSDRCVSRERIVCIGLSQADCAPIGSNYGCKWYSTSCVATCSSLSATQGRTIEDCLDRPDCYASGDTCYDNAINQYCYQYYSDPTRCNARPDCFLDYIKYDSTYYSYCNEFKKCSDISSRDYCVHAKRCVWDGQISQCVDEIWAPVTEVFNCSAHYSREACNADRKTDGTSRRCVWNSNWDGKNDGTSSNNHGVCIDYPTDGCRGILHHDFGGVFYSPGSDCVPSAGCVWVAMSGGCSSWGECVENDGNITNSIPKCGSLSQESCGKATASNCFWDGTKCSICNTIGNSVDCYTQTGCMWDRGVGSTGGYCRRRSCSLYNGYDSAERQKYCQTDANCDFVTVTGQCRNKCSTYTSKYFCDTSGSGYCHWGGTGCISVSECGTYLSRAPCESTTTADGPCVWVSNSPTDRESGGCHLLYDVKNTMARSCDSIVNAEQCTDFEYTTIAFSPPINCSYINNKCVLALAENSIECVSLPENQCILYDECYWGRTGVGCQRFKSCKDLYNKQYSYARNNLVCNERHDCIWDSYTKTCEDFSNTGNDMESFHNASKDCKNKGGYLANNICYSHYEKVPVSSCDGYDEKSCNGDNKLPGTVGCDGKKNKGCFWDVAANTCKAFVGCADIVDEGTCNNKQGCYYGNGICNVVVCSSLSGNANACNLRKECYYNSGCYSVEGFPKKSCEEYTSTTISSLDATKGTGEGCAYYSGFGFKHACSAYLWEEACNQNSVNGLTDCVWDDYHKSCVFTQGWTVIDHINYYFESEYAQERACLVALGDDNPDSYWDGGYCSSSVSTATKNVNKCSSLGDIHACNYDEQSCQLGCVWNSDGINDKCILFDGCSYITSPKHKFPERDCNAKKQCSWDGSKCVSATICQLSEPDCNGKPDCEWSVKENTCKSKDFTCTGVCGTDSKCWCDKHFRPNLNKPVTKCLDIESKEECTRSTLTFAAENCYWEDSNTAFPNGACLDKPTTIVCTSGIKEPRGCLRKQECLWDYSTESCVGYSDCKSITGSTAESNCAGKADECVWNEGVCIGNDDCAQFTEQKKCDDFNGGYSCVFVWSSNAGKCVKKAGCGVFVNRTQCVIERSCYWKNSKNANQGNCFANVEDAGMSTTTGTFDCSSFCDEGECKNTVYFSSSSYRCYWNGTSGKCLPYSGGSCTAVKNIDLCVKRSDCFWNSSHDFDGNSGGCQTFSSCGTITITNNPLAGHDCLRKEECTWNSSTTVCTTRTCYSSNKAIDCTPRPYCYWQSTLNNGSGACTYFWGCDEIVNDTDCQEKGCGWNKKNKACGNGPKSKAKWSKGAVASTVVLAVLLGVVVVAVVVAVIILIILWRKKKVGVSNEDGNSSSTVSGNSSSSSSSKGDGSDGEEKVPLLKGEEGGASNAGSGRGETLEQEVQDTPGEN